MSVTRSPSYGRGAELHGESVLASFPVRFGLNGIGLCAIDGTIIFAVDFSIAFFIISQG